MAGKAGRSGGRKKPAASKILQGTFRQDRDGSRSDAEEKKRAAKKSPLPSPPAFLSPAMAREWRRVAKVLHVQGLLRTVDRAALVGYVQACGELEEQERAIAGELQLARGVAAQLRGRLAAGEELAADDRKALYVAERIVLYGARLVPGKNDLWVRNPAVVTIGQAAKRAREFMVEFGMTPSADARMQFHRGDKGSGVESFRDSSPKAHSA